MSSRRPIYLLSASHLFSDLNQGALPAMLPYLIAERHFSYSVAAGLVLATNLASSVLQPIFGHYADRRPTPWLAPFGLLLAGLGVSFAGVATQYPVLLASVAVTGVGLAAFHPEAARLVHQSSGERRASNMSLFTVGGNAGFAVGPLVTTSFLAWGGLHGSLLLSIPAVCMALILLLQLGHVSNPSAVHAAKRTAAGAQDDWPSFSLLTATIVFRSVVFFGLNTFVPLYWIGNFHQSKAAGGTALSTLLFSGAMGTLIGGRLADRIPRRRIVITSLCLIPFLLFGLTLAPTPDVALAMLVPAGLVLFAPFSIMVVMGQEYLPNRIGVASGVTMGLAGTIGGLATPLLGKLADQYGVHAALWAVVATSAIAAFLGVFLKQPGWRAAAAEVDADILAEQG